MLRRKAGRQVDVPVDEEGRDAAFLGQPQDHPPGLDVPLDLLGLQDRRLGEPLEADHVRERMLVPEADRVHPCAGEQAEEALPVGRVVEPRLVADRRDVVLELADFEERLRRRLLDGGSAADTDQLGDLERAVHRPRLVVSRHDDRPPRPPDGVCLGDGRRLLRRAAGERRMRANEDARRLAALGERRADLAGGESQHGRVGIRCDEGWRCVENGGANAESREEEAHTREREHLRGPRQRRLPRPRTLERRPPRPDAGASGRERSETCGRQGDDHGRARLLPSRPAAWGSPPARGLGPLPPGEGAGWPPASADRPAGEGHPHKGALCLRGRSPALTALTRLPSLTLRQAPSPGGRGPGIHERRCRHYLGMAWSMAAARVSRSCLASTSSP